MAVRMDHQGCRPHGNAMIGDEAFHAPVQAALQLFRSYMSRLMRDCCSSDSRELTGALQLMSLWVDANVNQRL